MYFPCLTPPHSAPSYLSFLIVCWLWKGGREIEEGFLSVIGTEADVVHGEEAADPGGPANVFMGPGQPGHACDRS